MTCDPVLNFLSSEGTMATAQKRRVRSFVRRAGRITHSQQRALEQIWPRFGLESTTQTADLDAVFGRTAPRVLDIGFGDGEALLTTAVNNPETDFLGVEVHEPGIGHLLVLLERAGIDNVRIVQHDAVEVIDQMLMTASLDVVNIFFPDPWPKKRHHKRRLIQAPFLDALHRTMKPNSLLHLATDWQPYAEHMLETLAERKDFRTCDDSEVATNRLAARPPTKFERRGQRLGHTVSDFYFVRQS